MKPRVAITAGDPAGIGPEVAALAAADSRVLAVCEPVIYSAPDSARFTPGVLSAEAGRAAYDVIVLAVDDARPSNVQASSVKSSGPPSVECSRHSAATAAVRRSTDAAN